MVRVGETSWTLVAHAIVSREGHIADADGAMPPGLHVREDQVRFRAALQSADVTILGREGHERHPPEDRRRVVLTSRVTGVEGEGAVVFWNPAGADLAAALARVALARFAPDGPERMAVVAGGTRVMTTLLPMTDHFDLAIAPCSIPEGRACLEGTRSVDDIGARLTRAGLVRGAAEPLGAAQLNVWRRQAPPVST